MRKVKKFLPAIICFIICVISLLTAARTFPKKADRVDPAECQMVQARIVAIKTSKVKSGKYLYDTKYDVTYEYEKKRYTVEYFDTFSGIRGTCRQMCLYEDQLYNSYQELEHRERVNSVSWLTKASVVVAFLSLVAALVIFIVIKREDE